MILNVGASLAKKIVNTKINPLDYIKDSFPFYSKLNSPDVKEVNDITLEQKKKNQLRVIMKFAPPLSKKSGFLLLSL